jgi:Secretion system C-terminal sorting domain
MKLKIYPLHNSNSQFSSKSNYIFKSFMLLMLFIGFQATKAQQIYYNGGFNVSGTLKNGTAAPAGNVWSELQDQGGVANTKLGFVTNNTIKLADDFVVPPNQVWNISSIDVYAMYQYNTAPVPADFSRLYMEIYDQDPSGGGVVPIAGNMTTNVLNTSNSATTTIYRTYNTAISNQPTTLDYKIVRLNASISKTLVGGHYWIVYKIYENGFPNSTVISSPTVSLFNSRGGLFGWNAKTSNNGVWSQLQDGGYPFTSPSVQQELPFGLNGTAINLVSNYDCFNAINVTSFPYNFTETNGSGTRPFLSPNGSCTMNDGEWFKFNGTGNNIIITTSFVQVGYDMAIGVNTGGCSNFISCVGKADSYGSGQGETFTITNSQIGLTYYVNIANYSSTINFPEGNFTINISEGLRNDDCENALTFNSLPGLYTENKGVLATNNNGFITNCSNGMNDGEWFNFTGNGRSVNIDLSNVQGNYDPEIGVYTGSCGVLNCADFADVGFTGGAEQLTIYNTILGQDYKINIGQFAPGIDNPEGNFTLKLKTVVNNDDCVQATNITSLPYTFIETEGVATSNNSGFITTCGIGMNNGEWFKVTGNGSNINIAVTNVESTYDPEIGVYTGSCTGFTCLANMDTGNDGGSESLIIPNSVNGQTYYINIGHYSDQFDVDEGNFTINVSSPTLANEKFEITKTNLYPNPVKDILNIENQENITNVAIYNLLGQEVLNKTINNNKTEIDVSGFTSGNYLVKITAENQFQTFKIVKE